MEFVSTLALNLILSTMKRRRSLTPASDTGPTPEISFTNACSNGRPLMMGGSLERI